MVNAFRYGFLGISDVHVGVAMGVIVLFNLAFFVIAYQLLQRGVGIRS